MTIGAISPRNEHPGQMLTSSPMVTSPATNAPGAMNAVGATTRRASEKHRNLLFESHTLLYIRLGTAPQPQAAPASAGDSSQRFVALSC